MYRGYYRLTKFVIMYKIIFFAILLCTYNYNLKRSKSRNLQIHFFRFFMSWFRLLLNLYSSTDRAAVQEKKLYYILKDSILLWNMTGRCYKLSVCFLFLENATINSVRAREHRNMEQWTFLVKNDATKSKFKKKA